MKEAINQAVDRVPVDAERGATEPRPPVSGRPQPHRISRASKSKPQSPGVTALADAVGAISQENDDFLDSKPPAQPFKTEVPNAPESIVFAESSVATTFTKSTYKRPSYLKRPNSRPTSHPPPNPILQNIHQQAESQPRSSNAERMALRKRMQEIQVHCQASLEDLSSSFPPLSTPH